MPKGKVLILNCLLTFGFSSEKIRISLFLSVKEQMIEKINEPIQVIVKFEKGVLSPLFFSWRHRDYRIKKIEFVHAHHQGTAKLFFFSALGIEANYELIFNNQNFTWRLGKIETL